MVRPVPKPASPINDEERRYLKELEGVAQDRGVLDQAKQAAGYVPKTAWRLFTDFVEREEAAVAGVLDVLQGTGREGENAAHRFLREAIGGTKLGNMFGLGEGDRELFGEVFEQGGMGEGGRLSDLIGDTWLTRRWDPTARGTAALGAAILFSPSSWVTLGAGGYAKMAGKAGTIVATKKAQEIAGKIYLKQLAQVGRKHGVMRGMRTLEGLSPQRLQRMENVILTAERNAMGLQGLQGRGRAEVMMKIARESEARVVEMAKRGKVAGLDRGRGLRIGSAKWLGIDYGGVKIADMEKLGRVGNAIADAAMTGKMGRLAQAVMEDVSNVDQLFNRLPFSLRQNKYFQAIEERRHSLKNGADEIIARHLGTIFEGVDDKLLKDKEFVKAWQRAADDKRFLPEFAAEHGELAARSVSRWHSIAEEMGAGAAKLDMIEDGQFVKISEQGYFPRRLNLAQEKIDEIYGNYKKREFAGGSLGRHENSRVFEYLEDLRAELRRAAIDPDKVIEMDLHKALGNYMRTHIDGVAGITFANDVVAKFAPTFGNVLRNISADMDISIFKLPESELSVMRDVLADFDAGRKMSIKQINQIAKLPKKSQAAFLSEAATRVKSVDEFAEMMQKFDRVIDGLELKDLQLLRERGLGYGRILRDLDVGEHPFKTGRLKGQKYLLPKAMLQTFADNEKVLSNGLPKAALNILKRFDLLTNTFKTSHTVLFPAFHVRNAISNVAAMAATVGLGQILNPSRAWRAWNIMHGKGEFTIKAANGRRYTRHQLTNLFDALDISPDRVLQAELVGGQKSVLARVPVAREWERVGSKIGKEVENFARAQYFLTMLDNGVGVAESARLMKQVLFDYADLSPTEREFMRRIFPFYTWTRKNVELQARNLLTRPAGTTAQVRALNTADRGPEADLLPEYMRGELVTQLKAGPGKALFITNIDLPISSVNVLWNGGVGKTLREQFNMFSPILKAPLEIALNLDSFSGQSIDGRRWMGTMGPIIDNAWPQVMKDAIELKKITTKDGRTLYTANGTRTYLLMKNLLLGRFVQEGTRALDMAKEIGNGDTGEGAMKLFRMLSGMRWTEIDLDEAQKARAKDRVERLGKWLLDNGYAAEYRRIWFPEGE